jgi:hypothetical protein
MRDKANCARKTDETCPRNGKGTNYLVYDPGPLVLLQTSLHLGESIENSLRFLNLSFVIPVKLERGLEDLPRLVEPRALLLELSPFYPHSRFRPHSDPALVNGAGPLELLVALLHLDIRLPGFIVWLPLHPPLKHLARPGDVLEELLEVDIFVPKLVDAWEEGDGAVEEVACMLHVTGLELHLGVAEP